MIDNRSRIYWGAKQMRSATSTIPCPQCEHPASIGLLQHTDEQGHPLKQELLFTCLCGYSPDTKELIVLWAAVHADGDLLQRESHHPAL
jgi:hypothetical protein